MPDEKPAFFNFFAFHSIFTFFCYNDPALHEKGTI